MARALWKAVIEFGAVSVPVKLYTAVRQQTIRFNMLHDQDHARLRQEMVCPAHAGGEKEVPREHIIRGYELRKGEYVIVQEQDLERCTPEASRSIRVKKFVDPRQIDPLFYEKAYYLGPDTHGHKPYALLVRAMLGEEKIAIAEFVMRGKQYLGAIRVAGGDDDDDNDDAPPVLVLESMRYADEVIPTTGDVEQAIRDLKVDERQVKMAEQLIETLAGKFEPARYKDEYRACVMEMIERKARGQKVSLKKARAPKATKAPDLTDVLRASLAQAKTRGGKDLEHSAHRRHARA
jgi:DNA end-binding protein Ku